MAGPQAVFFVWAAGHSDGFQSVADHLGAKGFPALVRGNGCSAVDVDNAAVAEGGEVVNGYPDAGMVVTADRVDGLADVVAEQAYEGHLAGIACQVLVAERG